MLSENTMTTCSSLDELLETFDLLDSWEERYQFLIDLGREVPPLPPEDITEENRVQGCQSNVWLTTQVTDSIPPIIELAAQSDAQVVKGLVAVLLLAYSGHTPEEILAFDIKDLFNKLGFTKHLSRSRSNGLFAMVQRVQNVSRGAL